MSDKPHAPYGSLPPERAGRRRLLQGSLGVAPVLMTVVSRPVLAGARECSTMSGFLSMPTSRHGQPQFCRGLTPGFWKQPQKFNQWPAGYYPQSTKHHPATKFTDIFNPTLFDPNTTLLQVLEMGAGPPNDLARHIAAEALNIAKGWVPVLTLADIQRVWMQYVMTGGGTAGYYEPTAGVKWYHDDIVDYLKSTMD